MSGYALHPEAYDDLDEVRGYIAQDNPDAADRVITEFFMPFAHWFHSPIKATDDRTSPHDRCASFWYANI